MCFQKSAKVGKRIESISWNGAISKYDLRDWSQSMKRWASTLSPDEAQELYKLLSNC